MTDLPPDTGLEALIARIAAITRAIDAACAAAAAGAAVDLTGLPDEADRACRAAQAAKGPDTQRLAPHFEALVHALDALADTLRRNMAPDAPGATTPSAGHGLGPAAATRVAARAYGAGPPAPVPEDPSRP